MELERQTEPLDQKKPWSELTEEEREAVRESWKHTLPEEFDVFCIGKLEYNLSDGLLNIPGHLYVRGNVDCFFINVDENFTVDGNTGCLDVNVGATFTVNGDFSCNNVDVGGDCTINGNVYSQQINVGGLFDCYDVDIIGCKIHAADYVCRCYKEEI